MGTVLTLSTQRDIAAGLEDRFFQTVSMGKAQRRVNDLDVN